MTNIFNQGNCSYCGCTLSLGDRFRCEIEFNEWASPSPVFSRVLLADRDGPVVPLPLCRDCRQRKPHELVRFPAPPPLHITWVTAAGPVTPNTLPSSWIVSNQPAVAQKRRDLSHSLRLLWLTVLLLFLLFLSSLRR